jgi:hypothetical protein
MDLANKTHNTYIKPNILDGGEILAKANATIKSKVEAIQNKSPELSKQHPLL